MPPTNHPLPRFIAEPPHELQPYGRWGERLADAFSAACAAVEEAGGEAPAGDIAWYPERFWCGRSYVPATAAAGEGHEFFGYVSFARSEDGGEPADIRAVADFTDETASQNPDWELDLSDQVIAPWRGPGRARGDVTLIWGIPLVPAADAAVATAELGGETVDQCGLGMGEERRFTLVAVDGVTGLGPDDLFLEIKLWDRRSRPIAVESLYEPE
jgi:hypothetical protein